MNNILTYSYDEVPCNLLRVINGVHTQVTGYSALLFKLFDKDHFFLMEFCPNVDLVQTGDVSVAKANKNLRTITILPRKFTLASQWFDDDLSKVDFIKASLGRNKKSMNK